MCSATVFGSENRQDLGVEVFSRHRVSHVIGHSENDVTATSEGQRCRCLLDGGDIILILFVTELHLNNCVIR